MEFLKRHLFYIICGLVGVGGIAVAVLGVNQMATVAEDMNKAVAMAGRIRTAGAFNRDMIEKQEKRVQEITAIYDKVVELAVKDAGHTQLVPEFFPNPRFAQKFTFSEQYRNALAELYLKLRAGTPPTQSEISDALTRINEELQLKLDAGDLMDQVEEPNRAGLVSASAAKVDEYVRAAITKAKNLYCYAQPASMAEGARPAFTIIPEVYEFSGEPPYTLQYWWAQVTLWVQQDIVEAIARINDEAAAELEAMEPKQVAWVGNLPVKEVTSINVEEGYVGTTLEPYAEDFTRNVSGPEFEILYFQLDLVIDARDLPMIVAELCTNQFTTLYGLTYNAEPPNLQMMDEIYGGEPVVRVYMKFQKIMFSKPYLEIMPDAILEELGKVRPRSEDERG